MKEANYPVLWAYTCGGHLFCDEFISRSIGILSDATGYDEQELFDTWDEYERECHDAPAGERVSEKNIFIDFILTTLECDW